MNNIVTIEIANQVATVTLNRPEKLNALSVSMFDAIIATGEQIAADKSIRAVVLRGAGKAFCAGLDLANFGADDGVTSQSLATRTHGDANRWQKVAWVWHEMPVPVIAAVHGVAFGGGLQIMMGTDIRFITADARLSITEVRWGLIPDMSGMVLFRHSVREDIIRELTYTHREFTGEQAKEYGFATHVSSKPFEDAMQLAMEIASKSPSAIVKAKKVFNEIAYMDAKDGLMLESVEQAEIIGKENQLEAVYAGMAKRDARFHDYQ